MAVRHTIVGIGSPRALEDALRAAYYLADDELSTAAYLALALGKPLLLEGAPGVGKTEAAKAIAGVLGRTLLRLQCYEGIDASAAPANRGRRQCRYLWRRVFDRAADACVFAPAARNGAADRRNRPLRP